ncbi:MAG: FGGY-family carbohydrate kinase [Synechococcales bacterium]|nr:FGGY-family carbohydrate kinase [Synechococcales bacterium]
MVSASFVGIDFGTSGARAIALSTTGEILATVRSRDWGLDCAAWQRSLFDLLAQLPLAVRQTLQGIAIDGTSSTVLLCDAIGHPLTAPLMYHDARAITSLAELRDLAPPHHTVLSATSSLAKLLWYRQDPTFAQARYFLHQADWLAFLLHGKLGYSDYHNSLKLGYDVVNLCYPDWLDQHPVRSLLPNVVPPGSPIAPLLPEVAAQYQINPQCRIHAGTTDSIAAFLASGASQPGEAVTSLGSTLVLKLLSQHRVEDSRYGIYSHRLGDLWLVGGASNTGGAVLKQFFSDDELVSLSAQIDPTRSSELDYYPLPHPGDRFPINNPNLPPRMEPRPQDPVQFLQGLLEGIARIETQAYQQLQHLGATPLQRVLTAGGGAKNKIWIQIRQNFLGVPVLPATQTEAAYGVATLMLHSGSA